jgi:hypothetical protein
VVAPARPLGPTVVVVEGSVVVVVEVSAPWLGAIPGTSGATDVGVSPLVAFG